VFTSSDSVYTGDQSQFDTSGQLQQSYGEPSTPYAQQQQQQLNFSYDATAQQFEQPVASPVNMVTRTRSRGRPRGEKAQKENR
jgi:hypothetical protein